MQDVNIVIVGVGGQGTLLTSKLLARLAMEENLGVKVSEVHGMAQRGGSVITHVRIGKDVHAPLVAAGSADYLLAFEPLEAARAASYLKNDGILIVNSQQISPITVLSGAVNYPADPLQGAVGAAQKLEELDAFTLAVAAGSHRSVNIVLLGVLSRHLPFTREDWEHAIAASVPAKTLDINRKAFLAGCNYSA
ncbi:MAG TPA: indolepyruvate oxidoreductase subunit beta [Candidatus Limiplasma sp.]|nr:indolepyruvate oxidoreductase subunit beta [Candidatus Limiplasma sp.]